MQKRKIRIVSIGALLALAVLAGPGLAAPQPVALSNGAVVNNLTGGLGTAQLFRITVPAGATKLEIATSGGVGDCDLYVRRNAIPTPQQYDVRSIGPGTADGVRIPTPVPGTYYVLVFGASDFSRARLTAVFAAPAAPPAPPGPPAVRVGVLQNNVVQYGLAGGPGSAQYFKIGVPPGAAELKVSTTGTAGDCDLYLTPGALPARDKAQQSSTGPACVEQITVSRPQPGQWYLLVYGYSPFRDVKLLARVAGPVAPPVPPAPPGPPGVRVFPLQNNIAQVGVAGAAQSLRYFKITVPPRATELRVTTAGHHGDCDVYLEPGRLPDRGRAKLSSTATGSAEQIVVPTPTPGEWYVLLYGYSAYRDVTLLATVAGHVGPPMLARITITAPTAGVAWRIGGSYNITWQASPFLRDLTIEFSRDDGRTWSRDGLPPRLQAAGGNYRWTIPRDIRRYASSAARIRLSGTSRRGRVVTAISERFQVLGMLIPGPGHGPGHGPGGPGHGPGRLGRDSHEPNDTGRPATRLVAGTTQTHTIFPANDNDWISTPVVPGKYVILFDQIVGIELEVEAYIRNPATGKGNRIDRFFFKKGSGRIQAAVAPGMTEILLRIKAEDDSDKGAYRVSVRRVP